MSTVNTMLYVLRLLWIEIYSGQVAGRKIHAGMRHFAVLPLSLAVKPLKCAEGARHDLLPCPDYKNISKWGEKCMSN